MQGGIQSLRGAHAANALWAAQYRATVEAVHAESAPPTIDVLIIRYNTRLPAVPVAQTPYEARLPRVGDTVSVWMAEGVRDNAWASLDLPREDNSQPLPTAETVRFLHPSGALAEVDDAGNIAAFLPAAAVIAAGTAVRVAAPAVVLSGAPATGQATVEGAPGTVVPAGLPMTGGGCIWYTTGSATIGPSGSVQVSFVCGAGGAAANGSGPTALAYPFAGITAVSGIASGGQQGTSVSVDAAAIALGGATPVARKGDAVQVVIDGVTYDGTIVGGSSVVSAG